MGLFDDFFGTSTPEPSGGFFDGLFGGGSEQPSHTPLFGSGGEKIMPLFGHASGYGDEPFESFDKADKSGLMPGSVQDPDTGYIGTPEEIYDRYVAEKRDTTRLCKNFRKR